MEQGTGIEPAFTAWEAVVLPIYEPCVGRGIIAKALGKFNPFLSKGICAPGKNPGKISVSVLSFFIGIRYNSSVKTAKNMQFFSKYRKTDDVDHD